MSEQGFTKRDWIDALPDPELIQTLKEKLLSDNTIEGSTNFGRFIENFSTDDEYGE